MTLGPFMFAQPWALAGLLVLPVIWWLLRATPPEPQQFELPSLKLLKGLDPKEETPDKTPWWIILLRVTAAALAILGFARPSMAPDSNSITANGPVLIIVDDGWAIASRWREATQTAINVAEKASEDAVGVSLLFTAPRDLSNPLGDVMSAEAVRRTLQSSTPAAWNPDRLKALDRLKESELRPAQIIWISDGRDYGHADDFGAHLSGMANLEIRPVSPRGAFAISSASFSALGADIIVDRANDIGEVNTVIIAQSADGTAIDSEEVTFQPGESTVTANFEMPAAALNQVMRFRILGSQSAGGVWLWDDRSRTMTVGLADPAANPQPLLEEYYYVRKALAPNAQLLEASLSEILSRSPDAIIMGDRTAVIGTTAEALDAWIKAGGALIRFAGPKLAGAPVDFTSVPLRPSSRALGGVLAWEDPQTIDNFPINSPFVGIQPPQDALVRRQVLAQPATDLSENTWARLADGTPLVTASSRGRGMIILFHVTADPDWSDLPYTGIFPELLRRAAASGGLNRSTTQTTGGTLTPLRTLNGFGVLQQPLATTEPIPVETFESARASSATPPGLYTGPNGTRALNAGREPPPAIDQWPATATVVQADATVSRHGVYGILLGTALILLLIDAIVALVVSGRLFRPRNKDLAVSAVMLACSVSLFSQDASAQAQTSENKAREASLELRLAYVDTQNSRRNEVLEAGLRGLGLQLFRRTSVEPAEPHSVRLGIDHLEVYPMIYFSPPRGSGALTEDQIEALNTYMRNGGSLFIDTADALPGTQTSDRLAQLIEGLDVPPLQPTPQDHVLRRSFYLLDAFPGRYGSGNVWIEADAIKGQARRGDGVSALFIGDADWAGAWAVNQDWTPMFEMDDGEYRRELAYRFGINLVMYILTGNYKEDQVHVPDLLERLGETSEDVNSPGVRTVIDAVPLDQRPDNLQDFFNNSRRAREAIEGGGRNSEPRDPIVPVPEVEGTE